MKDIGRLIAGILSLILLIGSVYGITHRQQILDYLALRNYEPGERIIQLADRTTMTDPMRRVFYINHPQLNGKQEFRDNCPGGEETIVLGCYIQFEGIYLHDVKDERLDGIVEVTAAHEALHAQYDRLGEEERKRIDSLTQSAFDSVRSERVRNTVEQYRSKDPSIVPNELHSILATEVKELPDELESYYGQYFSERAKIVQYSEKYEQTFLDLTAKVEQYDERLGSLKSSIESNRMEIEALNNELEIEKKRLDTLMNSGRTEEYNAAVPSFNSKVNEYNSIITRTRNLIDEYNSIVEKRNDIATTEQQLIEAINSNIVPDRRQN